MHTPTRPLPAPAAPTANARPRASPSVVTNFPKRNLDVLRGIAVLAVFVSHLAQYWTTDLGLVTANQLGTMGVLLFFVHTSLVLMGSLERGERAGNTRGRLALDFYVRRFFRLYPLAIVAVLAVVIFRLPRMPDEGPVPINLGTLLGNLTLTMNFFYLPQVVGPLWSLPVEVQMYITLPVCYLIARYAPSRTAATWLIAVGVCVGVAQTLAMQEGLPGAGRLTMLAYAPCFIAGVWAYSRLRTTRRWIPAVLWLPLIVSVLLVYPILSPAVSRDPWRGWLFTFAIAALIPLVKELRPSPLTAVGKWIATYSYGIYLFHIPVFVVILGQYGGPVTPGRAAVAVVTTLGVSVLLYHVLEHPLIARGSRVASRLVPLRHVVRPR